MRQRRAPMTAGRIAFWVLVAFVLLIMLTYVASQSLQPGS
jgi:hypothetical protein